MSKIVKPKLPTAILNDSTVGSSMKKSKRNIKWKDKRGNLEKAIAIDAALLKKVSNVQDSLKNYNKELAIDIPVNEFINTLLEPKEAPMNINDVSADLHFREILEPKVDLEKWLRFRSPMKVDLFEGYVRGRFQNNVIGYCVQVFQDSKNILTIQESKAKNEADGLTPWTVQTKMHIASCTKFISSLGLAKAMEMKDVRYDEYIYKYLPAYWRYSANARKVTFDHILKHISGFNFSSSVQHYKDIKGIMEGALNNIGSKNYCNANFGIIRMLIPIIMGDIKTNFLSNITKNIPINLPFIKETLVLNRDIIWNVITMNYYRSFMLNYLFNPAGVDNFTGNPDLSKISGYPSHLIKNKALGYVSAHDNSNGMNSGDLSSSIGGYGLRLSVEELHKILKYGTTSRKFIKSETLKILLNEGYGINQHNTVKGVGYIHTGSWSGDEGAELCIQCLMPEGVRIVAFVNSSVDHVTGGIYDAILSGYDLAMR